ncbi:MerR family transcriptional regulator [Deinococcus deserti]|uniref:HTH merR-type domain-containing protein n=1 Tax=Deinococcus deserti (strain DSM 17065 / CIP 109153 / LMG 22923 / VCD115) TaxID=546414 RepID=C1D2W9_DEIDV|nr:MerR family transcriptional regulator [Deinococcus deserti]ACO47758.1 hypothetical protein Deide_2p00910 [Deinococcus deserti VCD115]
MSALILPEDWSGTLDDLVETANRRLPDLLPLDRAGRTKDDVNARLVRHYTTERLLDEPLRVGREARYTRRHLLQLLALRKLMAEGFGAAALQGTLQTRSDPELEALLTGETQLEVQTSNPALEYLQALKRPSPAPATRPVLASSPSVLPPSPERFTRLILAPGLEVHVRHDVRLPRSKLEQDRLAQMFLDALNSLRRPT